MKKYYLLEGPIEKDSFLGVMNWVESIYESSANHPVTPVLYINSEGGRGDLTQILIEELSQLNNLEVVACGELCSAALTLFLKVVGIKKISKWFRYAMYHKPDTYVYLRDVQSVPMENPSSIMYKDYKRACRIDNDLMQILNLSKKERALYRKGQEVYFDRKRIKEILKNNSHAKK